jgi:Uma2 family endonuclease
MVTTPQKPTIQPSLDLFPSSLSEWLENPIEGTEWVNDQLLEKTGMTRKHSKVQRLISTLWANYRDAQNLGGEVYTEVACRTIRQGRRPDVAYITPNLLKEYGEDIVLPQSFPLIAEIVSPTDLAEDIFAKADKYLASSSEEVWLVFPENRRVIVITAQSEQIFRAGEIAKTQQTLPGFSVAVDELLA